MPRHDIECKDCGHRFEVVTSITEGSPKAVPCPTCSSTNTGKKWDERACRFACVGPGWSGRTFRNKHELTKKNTKLAKSQWDNHAPVTPAGTPRNPTPGGAFDPGKGKT